jgi:amino acid transporter
LPDNTKKLGTLSTLSIGIGGMVGGGIFATTGLAVELTRGAVPIAFLVGGVVALLTSYSYLKLTLTFPSEGGTVEFLKQGLGTGILTGATNILLCFSYVVLLAVYAYAFGSYAVALLAPADPNFWRHVFVSAVLGLLALLNLVSGSSVVRSENFFNISKMILLAIFIAVGFATPIAWHRFSPENYVAPMTLISGAVIVFFNYEGFELIANAAKEVKDPQRSLPIAYIGGVLMVLVIYLLILVVVIGHLTFSEVAAVSDYALSGAAESMMGKAGHVMIAIAAMLATISAINATYYSSGRLTYVIARSGELPVELERKIHGQHAEGMIVFAVLSLLLVNFVSLGAIATMGSVGFLLIFMAVNIANVRLAKRTDSKAWISLLGAVSCGSATLVLCIQIALNPATRSQLWVLGAMVAASLLLEVAYRTITGRTVHLSRPDQK